MNKQSVVKNFVVVVATSLILLGCGKKSNLYLPIIESYDEVNSTSLNNNL